MVYSKPQEFGELTLVFSAGETAPPQGYYALAGMVDESVTMTWVKETHPGSGALAEPVEWEDVSWGSIKAWRPVAPSGYRGLSDAFSSAELGLTPVPRHLMRCVKETINGRGYVALGAKLYALLLETVPPGVFPESPGVLVAPGKCTWNCMRVGGMVVGKDPGDVYVLDLPVRASQGQGPSAPVLQGYDIVPQTTPEAIDREVIVPCTAVYDRGKTPEWIVVNSPTYTLRRKRFYTLVASLNLKDSDSPGEISQAVRWGITKTQSESFHESTGTKVGFEVGVEAGVEFEGIGAKVHATASTEISHEMGYETSHSVSTMREEEVAVKADAKARHTTALYAETHTIHAVRNDVNHSPVSDSNGLTFKAGVQAVAVQYPPPKPGETLPWAAPAHLYDQLREVAEQRTA
ncbi:hypothetical protein [Streptomyces olivoreticuli]|uniref:hypothetical protein n=1 Tax=Streptomyces olivoreticuli TaxID=68246 RepID=UPI000E28A286|nr:hypothetical protein [Streptomyces olivoreticuli]